MSSRITIFKSQEADENRIPDAKSSNIKLRRIIQAAIAVLLYVVGLLSGFRVSKNENVKLQSALDSSEEEIVQLTNQLEYLSKSLEFATTDLEDTNRVLAETNSEYEKVCDELKQLKSRYTPISDRSDEDIRVYAEITKLSETKDQLEQSIKSLEDKYATLVSQYDTLQKEYEAAKKQGPPSNGGNSSGGGSGSGQMVWIPRTGSKYHSRSNCSNMRNPSQVTLDEAIALGYTKCSKCW